MASTAHSSDFLCTAGPGADVICVGQEGAFCTLPADKGRPHTPRHWLFVTHKVGCQPQASRGGRTSNRTRPHPCSAGTEIPCGDALWKTDYWEII